jgi:putative membrane protein
MMGGGMVGMHGFGGMGLFGGWIGLMINLAIIIGIVVLVVWSVRRFTSGNTTASLQSPKEILQSRYARGEITREQYQQMLSDLA